MNNLINSSLQALKEKKIPNPELDLRLLLKYSTKSKKEIILSNFDFKDIDIKCFKYLLEKRLKFEPISKIINKKFFWKHQFYVNSNVLDPRPETEIILEEFLINIANKHKKINVLDIGTGSGCLAVSIAKEYSKAKITAIDVSKKALEVAKKNVFSNNLQNQISLKLEQFYNLDEKFDVIVSNPPYLSYEEYDKLQINVKNYEPKLALSGGKDGLRFYKLFAKKIEVIMSNNSFLILEIGHNQLNSCLNIFKKSNLKLKKISKDINKIDRTLTFFKI